MKVRGLWGMQLGCGTEETVHVSASFTITMASISQFNGPERTSVYVLFHDTPFLLCSLIPEKIEQQVINITCIQGEHIKFRVHGPNTIHLMGNYISQAGIDNTNDDFIEISSDNDQLESDKQSGIGLALPPFDESDEYPSETEESSGSPEYQLNHLSLYADQSTPNESNSITSRDIEEGEGKYVLRNNTDLSDYATPPPMSEPLPETPQEDSSKDMSPEITTQELITKLIEPICTTPELASSYQANQDTLLQAKQDTPVQAIQAIDSIENGPEVQAVEPAQITPIPSPPAKPQTRSKKKNKGIPPVAPSPITKKLTRSEKRHKRNMALALQLNDINDLQQQQQQQLQQQQPQVSKNKKNRKNKKNKKKQKPVQAEPSPGETNKPSVHDMLGNAFAGWIASLERLANATMSRPAAATTKPTPEPEAEPEAEPAESKPESKHATVAPVSKKKSSQSKALQELAQEFTQDPQQSPSAMKPPVAAVNATPKNNTATESPPKPVNIAIPTTDGSAPQSRSKARFPRKAGIESMQKLALFAQEDAKSENLLRNERNKKKARLSSQ